MLSRFTFLLLVFLSLGIVEMFSQEVEEDFEEQASEVQFNEDVTMFEFSVDRLVLLNNFKTNVGKNLIGVSCSLLNQRDTEAYSFFGLNLNYSHIGSFSGTVSDGGFSFADDSSSNFVSALFVYRHYLPFYYKIFEPHFEIGVGPQYFFTTTTTTYFDEQSTSEINFENSDFGLAYGINLGFTIKVIDQFFALAKAGFYGGTATTYYSPEDELTTNYPIDSFNLRTSQTNFLKISLGIAYSF